MSFAGKNIPTADFVYTNATVYAMNEAQPSAEVVVVSGSKIIMVGSSQEAKAFLGPDTEVCDLKGKTVTPGFVSAHDHLIASAWTSAGVQLYDAKDKAAALAKITAYAEANPDHKVVKGIGWDKNMLRGLPLATELDAAVSDRPQLFSTTPFTMRG